MPDTISPRGVVLPEGLDSSPPNDYRIRWVSNSDGSTTAEIYGYQVAASSTDFLKLAVYSLNRAKSASITLQAANGSSVNNPQEVDVTAQTETRTLVRDDGQSNYAQRYNGGTPLLQTNRYNYGSEAWNWPGGVQTVDRNIAHGLGITPLAVLLSWTSGVSLAGAFYYPHVSLTALNATNFTYRTFNPPGVPGAGTGSGVHWVAFS